MFFKFYKRSVGAYAPQNGEYFKNPLFISHLCRLFFRQLISLLFIIEYACKVHKEQQQICRPHRQALYKSIFADGHEKYQHERENCGKDRRQGNVPLILRPASVEQEYND